MKEQFIDMRRFNTITSNGEKPQFQEHLEICLMLGIPYLKRNKIAFQMPFWDILEMYPLLQGNKVPGRMYMLAHTLGVTVNELRAYGYNNMYKTTYQNIPDTFTITCPRFDDVPLECLAVPFLGARFHPEDAYKYIVVESIFNPYPTMLHIFNTTGKWYSPNAIWDTYAALAEPASTGELKQKIRDGYNPMFDKYTPNHKFEILEPKLSSKQMYDALCGVIPSEENQTDI